MVIEGTPGGAAVKSLPASAGEAGNSGSAPGQEAPLEWGLATRSNILACEIPWTEEPGGLVHAVAESDAIEHARTHARTHTHTHTQWL